MSLILLDDTILDIETLLEIVKGLKSEFKGSTKPTIDFRVRKCQQTLSTINTKANVLLKRLPSKLAVTAPIAPIVTPDDVQQQADLNLAETPQRRHLSTPDALFKRFPPELTVTAPIQSTPGPSNTQEQADENSAGILPTVPTPAQSSAQIQDEPERPNIPTRTKPPNPSLSSADSRLVAEVIAGFGDTIEREEGGNDEVENRQGGGIEEIGRESHSRGGDVAMTGDPATVSRDDGGKECAVQVDGAMREAVDVVKFTTSQMGNQLVAELEALAAEKPDRCYDKISLEDFTPPDFSQTQSPASGYMRGSRFTKNEDKVVAQLINAEFTFPPASALSQRHTAPSREDMKAFFQRVFDNPPSEPLPYFVGPPPMPSHYTPFVDAGPRLRQRNRGNIPGVNTPYWYISRRENTPATLHIEDGDLGSVNLVLAGAPKIWLFIPACEKGRLEDCMGQLYGRRRSNCSQHIRHYNALISPSLLEEWGIAYHLDCCLPGEMIITRRNTYHQVLNMGQNVAESVNIEFSNTPDLPPSYVWCTHKCGPHTLTASHFSLRPSATSPLPTTSNMKRQRQSSGAPDAKKSRTVAKSLPTTTGTAYGCFSYSQVRDKFAKYPGRTHRADDSTIDLLTRLFFAIGSPEAWCQLQQACRLARDGRNSNLFCRGETPAKAMEALDKVEGVVSSCSVVHRHHLMSLSKRRQHLVKQQKAHGPEQRTRNGRVQRAETLAIDQLHQEAFPSTAGEQSFQQSAQRRKKLESRLHHGRHWVSLGDRFSAGTLALVATGPSLTNSQIETVKDKDFDMFLDILDQERGDTVRRLSALVDSIYDDVLFNCEPSRKQSFEEIDRQILSNTEFDSECLLQWCSNAESAP